MIEPEKARYLEEIGGVPFKNDDGTQIYICPLRYIERYMSYSQKYLESHSLEEIRAKYEEFEEHVKQGQIMAEKMQKKKKIIEAVTPIITAAITAMILSIVLSM